LRASPAVVVLMAAALLAGCGGSSERTVTVHLSGEGTDLSYTAIKGDQSVQGNVNAPGTFPFGRAKAGTFVSFAVASMDQQPYIITCELTSNGRVIATASGFEGTLATCTGKA
jgi:hypothetical protein